MEIVTNEFKQALERAEKQIYLEAYRATKYNQSATARLLGVSRGKFRARLKQWRYV